MDQLFYPAKKILHQRWWISLPFMFALVVLTFIAWTILKVTVYPHDGLNSISTTGLINDIDPAGPTFSKLHEGDIILTIDGISWEEAIDSFQYSQKKAGDQVEFIVNRNGESIPVTITLAYPLPTEVIIRLLPVFLALLFWVIGLAVKTLRPTEGPVDLFFIWAQGCAITLVAGVVSYLGPAWGAIFFSCMLWLIGPLSVHFHMYFPQSRPFWGKQALLIFIYILAFIGIALYLFIGPNEIRSTTWYPIYSSAKRLFLAGNLLIVLLLFIYTYRHPSKPGTRVQIRIVALGGAVTVLPFVALTILPDALFQQPIIPYRFAFLFLGILPLTYGFAIYRFHLIEYDTHVNRGATYILIYSLLGGAYLILNALFLNVLPWNFTQISLINTFLVLILATLFLPLSGRVQKFVDKILYGGWYDYRSALTKITQGLEQITDLHVLANEVSHRLVDTLRLQETCVFLRDINGEFSVIEVALSADLGSGQTRNYPILPRTSLTYLLRVGAIERTSLKRELAQAIVTPQELELLNSEQINLWVPIIGHGQILGLLALGPKLGGDIFSGEDMDILRSVVRNISTLIDNIYLLTRLRQYAAELEQRVNERTVELYNAKERVEAILASVGDGVIVTDLEGDVIKVNTAYERQSGYKEDEIIGRNLLDLLSEDNAPNVLDEIGTSFRVGDVWKGELVTRHKSGRQYDAQLTIAPVRDQNGQIISYVGSQTDITRQKDLERIKDHFIADVSHELRTPTTNINLYLDLLEYAAPEKRQQYMSIVREQSQLLTKLVEDILDLSRLARAKFKKEEFIPVNLNALIDQVIAAHRAQAAVSKVEMFFIPLPNLPLISGEQNQLARLISNLVGNAIRYSGNGKIYIRTFVSDSQACLQVEDTGMGIEAEDLPHIFERFYRGRNVRQSKVHGTGLGLAIVKEIVNFHDGRIEVRSEVGRGSTFCVWLPIREE